MKRALYLILFLSMFMLLTVGIAAQAQDDNPPVPAGAYDPNVDLSNGYFVEEIGNGLYWITEGSYQVMFLTTGEGVIVVDAPPSIGENILAAISSVTDEPITHVIYSHTHADHIAAASVYPEDATYIAHETVAETLANRSEDLPPFGAFLGGSPVPIPTQTFSDSLTLEVGSQTLELQYLGPAHEEGNLYIYAPEQKVLMLVDVIFPGWVPFAYLALAEDVHAFYDAHEQVLEFDFETFIGGHLTRLGTREDVETQIEYVTDVQNASAQAFQEVDFFAIANEVGFEDQWLLFDTYLDAVAQNCADAVSPAWVDRLGGVNAYTFEHCWTVVESLRID